jgi:hypothetical protein
MASTGEIHTAAQVGRRSALCRIACLTVQIFDAANTNDQFQPGRSSEPSEERRHVVLDRLHGAAESRSDLLVGAALAKQAQHISLTRRHRRSRATTPLCAVGMDHQRVLACRRRGNAVGVDCLHAEEVDMIPDGRPATGNTGGLSVAGGGWVATRRGQVR